MKFSKKLLIFISTILLLALPPAQVFAARRVPNDILSFFASNDIFYYNPKGAASGSGCYSGEINVYGEDMYEKHWTGLTSFLSPEQAAGVMGNLNHEGSFNPARHEDSQRLKYPGYDLTEYDPLIPYGIGIAQWSGTRRVRLINYIKEVAPEQLYYIDEARDEYAHLSGGAFRELVGDDVANAMIAVQLEFMKGELDGTDYYSFTDAAEAAEWFLKNFERPRNPNQPQRAIDAEKFYDQFVDATISSDSGTGDYCIDTGGLQEYVLLYAWPDYHKAPYTELTEAYAEAVNRRLSIGKWVGGISYPGVDCGGFVTTLIQESGYDPGYNPGNSYTVIQESYLNTEESGWILLNDSHYTEIDTSILQTGDVSFSGENHTYDLNGDGELNKLDGHTFIYVGEIEGFNSKIASAGLDTRAPMAGKESLTRTNRGPVRWYRKVGENYGKSL